MEDERRDSDGTVGDVQKPGALKIYDGALSPEFCDELIKTFDLNEEKHEAQDDGVMKFIEYNYTNNHHTDEVHGRLMKHLGELFKQYLTDLGTGLHIKLAGFEQLRIKKYKADTEDKFDVHVDVTDHKSAIRACAFLFYLNDSNGNTDFPLQRLGVEPKKGRVVIFPPTWEYPHIGNKCTGNDKFIMSTYLHYA